LIKTESEIISIFFNIYSVVKINSVLLNEHADIHNFVFPKRFPQIEHFEFEFRGKFRPSMSVPAFHALELRVFLKSMQMPVPPGPASAAHSARRQHWSEFFHNKTFAEGENFS
jgi:hypothetical protein